jgi:Ca2+-transporting ATPase
MKKDILLQGLTAAAVEASRKAHGSNVMTPRERTPWWRKLAEKFTDPLIMILLVAAVLSIGISLYEYYGLGADATAFFEPVGIVVAILLATCLAFWFEHLADKEFSLLNQQNDREPVRVIRDGHETTIPRADIVVGDIVLLATGDEVPADGRLIEATQMQVDESTLTGEPVCHKSTLADEQDADATFPTDHVLRGTKLLEGHGIMEVEAVGDHTEAGHVFTEVQIDDSVRTPLNEQLDRLGQLIARASYAIAALVVLGRIVMWFVTADDATLAALGTELSTFNFEVSTYTFLAYLLQSLMLAVTLIVVAVPEGLPMAVTLSLAYSMRRMLKTNNLVRRLHACETMGAATVICTDKTGTLTQNQMRVVEMKTVEEAAEKAAEKTAEETAEMQKAEEAAEMQAAEMQAVSRPFCRDSIATNIAVNSTASLDGDNVLGNPTEGALLLWLRDQGVDYTTLRAAAHVTEEIPFTTERKYMATRVDNTLYIKGAPEIVMGMCSSTEESSLLLEWQQRGLRTLALAHAEGQATPVLDALVAIADPVREDVPAAVQECLTAGIDVKIVTGDTPATAAEIARQIGLMGQSQESRVKGQESVVTGPQVAAMSDDELRACAKDIVIIARARPMDKQRLVQALQACGEVVAVTGDGTNDAPALHAAHVGLSMGDGTAVAKEASDITIIDNSFASIGRAVMWGRSLYRNIQRFILFQMTVNVCACLTVLAGSFMGTDAPLTVTQMLWVNLIMDTFAAMALASLPPTEAVMRERPRDRRKFIISTPMWQFILWTGGLFFVVMTIVLWYFERDGHISPYDQSLFFTTFVMLQFWNLFNARAFLTGHSAFDLRNCKEFLFIAALIFFGQIAIVELGGKMFNVEPLDVRHWVIIFLVTSPVLLLGESIRFFKSRLNLRARRMS